MFDSRPKVPWPIEEVECEVVEVDDSRYKELLFSVYSGLQRVRESLCKEDTTPEEA